MQQINPVLNSSIQSLTGAQNTAQPSGLSGVDFQQVLEQARTQIRFEDYLNYKYKSKYMTVKNNGKVDYTGMITRVEKKDDGYYVDIWDGGKQFSQAKLTLTVYPTLPVDLNNRDEALAHQKRLQQIQNENYINKSDIIGASEQSVNPVLYQNPAAYKTVPEPLEYTDVRFETGKRVGQLEEVKSKKTGHFVVKDNILYLKTGHPVVVGFEAP